MYPEMAVKTAQRRGRHILLQPAKMAFGINDATSSAIVGSL